MLKLTFKLAYVDIVRIFAKQTNKQLEIMTHLQSTKAINSLKLKAIKNGGYVKYKNQILEACANHKEMFGIDLTPKHLI